MFIPVGDFEEHLLLGMKFVNSIMAGDGKLQMTSAFLATISILTMPRFRVPDGNTHEL